MITYNDGEVLPGNVRLDDEAVYVWIIEMLFHDFWCQIAIAVLLDTVPPYQFRNLGLFS